MTYFELREYLESTPWWVPFLVNAVGVVVIYLYFNRGKNNT